MSGRYKVRNWLRTSGSFGEWWPVSDDGLARVRRMKWPVCPCAQHPYPGWRMVKVRPTHTGGE